MRIAKNYKHGTAQYAAHNFRLLKQPYVFFFIFIIDGAKKISDPQSELLSSSAVEQVTVNHFVAGSIPA